MRLVAAPIVISGASVGAGFCWLHPQNERGNAVAASRLSMDSTCAVHQEGRRRPEERFQRLSSVRGKCCLVECTGHQRDPTITGSDVDRKGSMPDAQPRVASLLYVIGGSAEAENHEVPQPFLCSCEIVHRGYMGPRMLSVGTCR